MSLFSVEKFENQKVILDETIRILRKRRYLIILVLLTTVFSAYVALLFITEQYVSEASLLVKLGRENVEVPVTVARGGIYSTGVRQEEINSEIQLLCSRSLTERVIDDIGLDKFKFEPKSPENLLQAVKYYAKKALRWGKAQMESLLITLNLQKKLTDRQKVILLVERSRSIKREKDSDVITVSMKLPSADLCVVVIDELLKLYFEQRIKVYQHSNVKDFFKAQVQKYEQKLNECEHERKEFRIQLGLSSLSGQRDLLLQRLHDLYSKIDIAEYEKALLEGKLRISDSTIAKELEKFEDSEPLIPNFSVDSIKKRITELRLERVRLSGNYDASINALQGLELEIAKITNLLNRGLEARIGQLKKLADKIEERLNRLNAREARLREIDRDIKVAESSYLIYSKRKEEARISEELDANRVANIAIMSQPQKPIKPVYPRKLLIMKLCAALGLILGVSLALLWEYFSDKVSTRRDLADIEGLPFLGTFRVQEPVNRDEPQAQKRKSCR
jgi:uncharacterized protein involved in exopolysaccharide biosynthesis